MTKILFICLGNICRSPLAQGMMEYHLKRAGFESRVAVDSAGTAGYHVGATPDDRAVVAASRRGIDISHQRARQIQTSDFELFDYICAMDIENLTALRSRCPAPESDKLGLLLDFAPQSVGQEVPDPYYGGEEGFEHALDLIESGVIGLIEEIRSRHRQ